MTAAARYLDVTPQGVAQCMTGPPRDLPQRLLRALVLRSAGQPWSSDELAGLLPGGEPRAAAQALFRLQRDGHIVVQLEPPGDDAACGWTGLRPLLRGMIARGAEWAALSDADGLVLECAGAQGEADPDRPHALQSGSLALHVGEGALAATSALTPRGAAAENEPGLVPLVRRLARWRAERRC